MDVSIAADFVIQVEYRDKSVDLWQQIIIILI